MRTKLQVKTRLDLLRWSFWLAMKAKIPIWNLSGWRAIIDLANTASIQGETTDSPFCRVLQASLTVYPSGGAGRALASHKISQVTKTLVLTSCLHDKFRAYRELQPALFWDHPVRELQESETLPAGYVAIRSALNFHVSGDAQISPIEWFLTTYGPFRSVAVLGCNDKLRTELLLKSFPSVILDVFDVSPTAILDARHSISPEDRAADRCNFFDINLNAQCLTKTKYDAVLAIGQLHNVRNLDFCLDGIRQSLKPGGLFFFSDYCGPNHFQWSEAQLKLANLLLGMVPKKWRVRDRISAPITGAQDNSAFNSAPASQFMATTLGLNFEIMNRWACGGTLLGPILHSGCLDTSMFENEEGANVLLSIFKTEQELIRDQFLTSDSYIYVARPREHSAKVVRSIFEKHSSDYLRIGNLGITGDIDAWYHLNHVAAFESIVAYDGVAPFPPADLMRQTSTLQSERDFAAHGVDFLRTLVDNCRVPIASFKNLLDFGIGVGRLARMFKGFEGDYVGVDIDQANVDWVRNNLPWVKCFKTEPRMPLPFCSETFDAVISISVFTHMNEADHLFYLDELRRVTVPGAFLFISVSGDQVLRRAEASEDILNMLSLPVGGLNLARDSLRSEKSGFCFLRQQGHLTSNEYEYGATFISESYISEHWSKYFELEKVVTGGIHDFQDVVVLRRRAC